MLGYFLISIVALVVAGLTFFSGFGLGTLLMPAFAVFFPIEVAIAATAIVHLFNNLFKLLLVGKNANVKILLLFAVPAALFAILGAWLLNYFVEMAPIFKYQMMNRILEVTPVKIVIAILMIIFALVEILPTLNKLSFKTKYIPIGGILSGFFGGLSGHQGALRTAFLMRTDLTKLSLIGTMVFSSVIVDVSRLSVYGLTFFKRDFILLQQQNGINFVVFGCIFAFLGSYIGSRILKKITLNSLKLFISLMLFLIAVFLGLGVV